MESINSINVTTSLLWPFILVKNLNSERVNISLTDSHFDYLKGSTITVDSGVSFEIANTSFMNSQGHIYKC